MLNRVSCSLYKQYCENRKDQKDKTIKFLHLKKVISLLTVNDLKESWFTQSNTINVRTIIFSNVLTVQTNFFTLEESYEENGTLLYHDF